MNNKYEIKFKFWDELSNWNERSRSCQLYARNEFEAKQKCIDLYGLGTFCEYEFVSVTEIQ